MTDLVLPAAVAVTCFFGHALVNRLVAPGPRQRSPQRVAILVSLAAAAACTVTVTVREGIDSLPFAAVVSACIAYCYFHLFNMSETARRIRILTSCLLRQPIDDRHYSLEAMIDVRIDRLISIGALRFDGRCHQAAPGPLLAAAAVLDAWRQALFPARRGAVEPQAIRSDNGSSPALRDRLD